MDRGGEEAIREMDRQANGLLVEQLGRQMRGLPTGLAQKQEGNRVLRSGGPGDQEADAGAGEGGARAEQQDGAAGGCAAKAGGVPPPRARQSM